MCLSLSSPPPPNKEWEERRKQNIEKMNEEMEKIAEYERNQRVSATGAPWRWGGAAGWGSAPTPQPPTNSACPQEGVLEPNPVRNFLDDPRRRSGPLEEPERDRREGSRRHGRNWGGPDFERVRYGLEQERQVGAAGWATTAAQQPVSGFHGEGCMLNAGRRAGRGCSPALRLPSS